MLNEIEIVKPMDIEKRSMAIITEELGGRTWPEPEFSWECPVISILWAAYGCFAVFGVRP